MYNEYDTKTALVADDKLVLAEVHKQARAAVKRATKAGNLDEAEKHLNYIKQTKRWVNPDYAKDDDGKFVMIDPPAHIKKNLVLNQKGRRPKRLKALPKRT